MQIFHGNIVTSRSWEELAVFRNAYLTVDNGIVEGVYQELPEKFGTVPLTELGSSVLIPAFSDLHVHAPQFSMRGLGMDLLLADWLETHTFPQEARFSSMAYAVPVYEAFVDALIACGTFHACVYGTIHRGATGWLLERMEALGLRAFVGKVNMDLNSPKDLLEPTEESLSETEAFLEAYCGNAFARPILTPRFAPTCSFELLRGLGRLGAKYGVGMQTHIVESRWEAMESVRLNPHCGSDTGIYEKAGLLDNGPVLAGHFIFPTDEDIRILRRCGGIAVQCPDATVNVTAGIMKTAFLQDQGIQNVMYKPGKKDFNLYWAKDSVIVTDMISEAPVRMNKPNYIMLEKMLVDMSADKLIATTFSKAELPDVYEQAQSRYLLDKVRMLRYARRRNQQDVLLKYLEGSKVEDATS